MTINMDFRLLTSTSHWSRLSLRYFVGSLFLVAATALPLGAAQLTKGGRPTAVLVVPDSCAQADAAAERIRQVVGEMSGASLEIIHESASRPAGLLPVYVGHTRFAASNGARVENLDPEEMVLIATGCIRVDMPNIHHHWGTQGLNYYMLARLMWDETLDPSEVIDDYCRTAASDIHCRTVSPRHIKRPSIVVI